MSLTCERLHDLVQELPETRWPFDSDRLPRNGIYFFYEAGEIWGHGGDCPRIVPVGTHREGNFRSRMADHYVIDERKMGFNRNQAAPKDRSIFRKNMAARSSTVTAIPTKRCGTSISRLGPPAKRMAPGGMWKRRGKSRAR